MDIKALVFLFETFFLVLTRVTAFYAFAPVFGGASIPNMAKAGLGALTALVIFPAVDISHFPLKNDLATFAIVVAAEALLGLTMGFVCNLTFEGIRLAGSIYDTQLGFGIVSVVDPEAETEISLMAMFKYFVSVLAFLALDGHHYLIRALVISFRRIGIGTYVISGRTASNLVLDFSAMFEVGLQVAVPLMGAIILATVVLGILAKATPRIQIFLLSFPLRIYIGLTTLLYLMPSLVKYFRRLFDTMGVDLLTIIRSAS